MGVVSYDYGGLHGSWMVMVVVVGMHVGESQKEFVACLEMLEHFPSAR